MDIFPLSLLSLTRLTTNQEMKKKTDMHKKGWKYKREEREREESSLIIHLIWENLLSVIYVFNKAEMRERERESHKK